MMQWRKLSVGFVDPGGKALRSVRLCVERVIGGSEGGAALIVERTVYRAEGSRPYAVHSLLRQRRDRVPLLAKLEMFDSWEDLMTIYPGLARSAAHARAAPRVHGEVGTPGAPRDHAEIDGRSEGHAWDSV